MNIFRLITIYLDLHLYIHDLPLHIQSCSVYLHFNYFHIHLLLYILLYSEQNSNFIVKQKANK